MSKSRSQPLLSRLAQPVTEYVSGPFQLRAELDCLARVRSVAAHEAVVLYCSRILEVLTADALRAIKLEPSSNLFSNLDALQQYNLIPLTTLYWANALRRTGNQARHILGRITLEDAELSLLFTEHCLYWFFRDFRYGLKGDLTLDGESLDLGGQPKVRALVASLESLDQHFDAILAHIDAGPRDELWQASALPAALAEMCLNRDQLDIARKVLDIGRSRFPGDLRLEQLWGLHWSRRGEFRRALDCLEPLYKCRPEDEETAGITAGVYKRCWLKDRNNREPLEKSHRAYRQGWKQSRRTCAYLGINAAATALWLGQRENAKQMAGEVRKHLSGRLDVLGQDHPTDPMLSLNYWDQVTFAESELVLGNLDEARRLYNEAFQRHAIQQAACIGSTRMQLEEILTNIGFAGGAAAFLKAPPSAP